MTRKTKDIIWKLFVIVVSFSFGIFLIIQAGCSSKKKTFIETGYDTIKTSNSVINNLMTQLGKAYRRGEISKSEKKKITKVYETVRMSSDLLDETLADYANNKTQTNRQRYLTALEALNSNKAKFLKLAREVLNE